MSYRGQQEDIFTQELAFTPEMVQATPADIELGTIAGSFIPFKRKGTKDVGVFDLSQGRKVAQFAADDLPLTPRPGAGCLAPSGSTFACVKGKALFGSALRMIDVQSGSKSKSVSFDISSTSLSTFIHSSTPTITMADPGKRQISIWPLEQATKQPPRRLSEFSSMFPEGTTTKLVDLRHDDEWVVITELVQWPVLRAAFPQFHAGLMRTVRIRDGEARDMWGFAGAVVDVPVTGQWVKMFCFADRADPKAGMLLHFQDISSRTPDPHERTDGGDLLSFSVPIPTYDATDVPKYVHVVPQSLIVVVTVSGVLHAFSVDGNLMGSSRMQHMPPGGADLACASHAGNLYIKVGPIVVRVGVVDSNGRR